MNKLMNEDYFSTDEYSDLELRKKISSIQDILHALQDSIYQHDVKIELLHDNYNTIAVSQHDIKIEELHDKFNASIISQHDIKIEELQDKFNTIISSQYEKIESIISDLRQSLCQHLNKSLSIEDNQDIEILKDDIEKLISQSELNTREVICLKDEMGKLISQSELNTRLWTKSAASQGSESESASFDEALRLKCENVKIKDKMEQLILICELNTSEALSLKGENIKMKDEMGQLISQSELNTREIFCLKGENVKMKDEMEQLKGEIRREFNLVKEVVYNLKDPKPAKLFSLRKRDPDIPIIRDTMKTLQADVDDLRSTIKSIPTDDIVARAVNICLRTGIVFPFIPANRSASMWSNKIKPKTDDK